MPDWKNAGGAGAVASALGAAVLKTQIDAGRIPEIPSIGYPGEVVEGESPATQALREESRLLLDAARDMSARTGGGNSDDPKRAVSEGIAAARFYLTLLENNVPEAVAGKMAAAYVGRMRPQGGGG